MDDSAMDFESILPILKKGKDVKRDSWEDNEFIFLIKGTSTLAAVHRFGFCEYMNEPAFADTVFKHLKDNSLVAYSFSQEDIFANDWRLLSEE